MITEMLVVMLLAVQDPNVVALRQQIVKLNQKVAAQEAEIQRLRSLCNRHGIDAGTESTEPNPATLPDPNRFAFLGRRIGEAMNRVWADEPIQKDGTQMLDSGPMALGDLKVRNISWRYLDKKLVGFTLGVDSDESAKLHDYLVIRFGEPTSMTVRHTRLGYYGRMEDASYSVATWVFPEGNMTLTGQVYYDRIASPPSGPMGNTLSFVVSDFEQRRLDLLRTKAEQAFPSKQ